MAIGINLPSINYADEINNEWDRIMQGQFIPESVLNNNLYSSSSVFLPTGYLNNNLNFYPWKNYLLKTDWVEPILGNLSKYGLLLRETLEKEYDIEYPIKFPLNEELTCEGSSHI